MTVVLKSVTLHVCASLLWVHSSRFSDFSLPETLCEESGQFLCTDFCNILYKIYTRAIFPKRFAASSYLTFCRSYQNLLYWRLLHSSFCPTYISRHTHSQMLLWKIFTSYVGVPVSKNISIILIELISAEATVVCSTFRACMQWFLSTTSPITFISLFW